jgi:hypothetical protein
MVGRRFALGMVKKFFCSMHQENMIEPMWPPAKRIARPSEIEPALPGVVEILRRAPIRICTDSKINDTEKRHRLSLAKQEAVIIRMTFPSSDPWRQPAPARAAGARSKLHVAAVGGPPGKGPVAERIGREAWLTVERNGNGLEGVF